MLEVSKVKRFYISELLLAGGRLSTSSSSSSSSSSTSPSVLAEASLPDARIQNTQVDYKKQ